jgi:AcrR family transcriptional regulator
MKISVKRFAKSSAAGSDTQREAPMRQRVPAAQRRIAILDAAAAIFSERGFAVSTRDIGKRAGVTQALLYKHFRGKDELAAAVLDHIFADRFRGDWQTLRSRADSRSFEQRLIETYVRFARASDRQRMRLFVRAGLEGWSQALRRGTALTTLVFEPIIAELRAAGGLPDFATRPMLRGERELAMMLHGAIVFLSIRKHVYGMPMEDDPAPAVELYVRTFLAGAPKILRRLHAAKPDDVMAVTVLRPRHR